MMYSIMNNDSVVNTKNNNLVINQLVSMSTVQEESGRGCRTKKKQTDPICCPVCSITLRISELNTHLTIELERLTKLSNTNHRRSNNNHSESLLASSSSTPPTASSSSSAFLKCWQTYQKIKANRQDRLKVKAKKRKSDERTCPICNATTSQDEITLHVEMCLQRNDNDNDNRNGNDDDEMPIDVEGDDGGEKFEEYEWAGQMRVRASSLLEGGYAAVYARNKSAATETEDDVDVVVDGDDDVQMFGVRQYTDEDVTNAVSAQVQDTETEPEAIVSLDVNAEIIESLKCRIRELEGNEPNHEQYKCLICMGRYQTPVVSICCWHVHCEQCWLRTLAVKKLCPQCNMITSTSDLRRIYI